MTLETITGYIVKLNEGEDEAITKRTYTIDTTKDVNEFVIEYEKVEESSGEVVEEETVEPTAEPVGEEMATYAEASYIINEEGIAEITIKVIDELYAENENLNLLFAELPENVEYAYDNEVSWTFYTATNGEYTFTFTVFDNWDEIQTETSTITVEGVTGELEDEEELEISLYKRGNGGSTARDTTRVYIYVKLNPVGNVDTSNWVVNKDGWYTIGYIDIPVSKVREIDPSVDYAERKDTEYTPKAAAYVNANASSITYYNDFVKSAFKLEDTEWNASGYGLKSCNGATSYSKEEYSPYAVNGLNWHLDGLLTLKAEKTYTATVTFQYSDGVTENRPALQSNYEQNGLHANDKFSYATNNIDGFTKTISYNGTTIDAITDIVVYANNLTFIVTYTPKNYTITYVLNGGTTSENTVFSRDYGTDFPTINVPSRAGYTFDGWYSDVELMNKVETLPGKITGNVTYYAKWIENDDITITYKATTGGTVSSASETLAPATGTAKGSTATPAAGYHFVNWTNAAGEEVSTDAEFTPAKVDGVNVAATYTANFKEAANVTIKYEATTGGSVTLGSEELAPATGVAQGSTATASAGYHFVNWTNAAGTVVSTDAKFVPAKVDGVNVAATYTANFAANTDTKYTVQHLLQDLDDETVYNLEATDNLTGTTDTKTKAVAKSYPGFTPLDFVQQNIGGDGKTVVKIYYERNTYKVTINYVDEEENTLHDSKVLTVKHGGTYSVVSPEITDYTLLDPSQSTISGTVNADDVTVNVTYSVDKVGGEVDPEGEEIPDGTPDKYQVRVDYVAVNGTVDFDHVYVTLYEDDVYSETGIGHLEPEQIPGAKANAGFENGKWDVEPTTEIVIKENTVFTITFTAIPAPEVVPPNPGRTCQDDGYPEGYTWDEGQQACVCTADVCRVPEHPQPGNGGEQLPEETDEPVVVEEEVTPATPAPEVEEIVEEETPLVAGRSWALVNLIACITGAVLAIVLLIMKKSKSEELEDEYDENGMKIEKTDEEKEDEAIPYIRKTMWKVVTAIVAIVAVIVFFLTEDMRLPMVMVDKWTLLMIIFALVNVLSLVLGMKWHEDEKVVNIVGNSATVAYNGSMQEVQGYTTDINTKKIEVTLKKDAKDEVSGVNVGRYNMGLTADCFEVKSDVYSNIKLVVTDGYLDIKAKD